MERLTLKDAQEDAKKKGGKCLSNKYINCSTIMKWECGKGHIWEGPYKNIRAGNWCVKCSYVSRGINKRLDGIKIAKKIAKEREGECLSDEYVSLQHKLLWRCKEGHEWYSNLANIKCSNSWCLVCSYKSNVEKLRLNDGLKICIGIAKERGGQCLSKEYINNITRMRWECKNKHRWYARYSDVKQGTWCPTCSRLEAAKKANNAYILRHWKTGEEIVCVASYEKKVVEYFNKNKINFRWQHRVFKMPNGKTYRPDLYLFSTKKWIEIKGYFREDAKEKWEWFHKEKPNSEIWDEKSLKKMKIL